MHIEKSIEIPDQVEGRGPQAKYPFNKMDVGDSVFFEGVKSTRSKEYIAATTYGSRSGKKFCGRKSSGGIRVWRVK